MANKRKRKVVAAEPASSAAAEAAPPAKRGRPPKATKEQENTQEPATDAPPPAKRGRPAKATQEQENAQEPVIDAAPPKKRGRPPRATKEQENAQEPATDAAPPKKRGRPLKENQEPVSIPGFQSRRSASVQAVRVPASRVRAAPTSAEEPKSKVAGTPTRSSERLSDTAAQAFGSPSGARETGQTANEKANGSVVAVKEAKGKSKAKATAKASTAPVSETLSVTKVIKSAKGHKGAKAKAKAAQLESEADVELSSAVSRDASVPVAISAKETGDSEDEKADDEAEDDGPNYWLMKAEPESRIEKGKDVKFSIDDLRVATEPEGWDGVRNPTARNNMRMMMKGDLAFFYHSNCKVPGIAGIMEIVQEHSPDEAALDPSHPYYDPKATAENPKWCKVHVSFRRKFPTLIKLKELQKYAKDGGVLQHMQTLRQSRLSVSKVTKKEWDFVMSLVDDNDADAGPSAPVAPIMGTKAINGPGSVNGQSSAADLLIGEVSRVTSGAAETLTNGLNSIREAFEQAPDAAAAAALLNPANSIGKLE